MTDIETRLAESLTARADRPVEVERLTRGAVTRARRVRARRRVLVAASLTAAVVAGAFGVRAALPDRPETTLPAALGVPSAASQPDAIGTDPALLHFDVDLRALGAATGKQLVTIDWISGENHEWVAVYDADDITVASVRLAPSAYDLRQAAGQPETTATDVTVDGRPAQLDRHDIDYGGRVVSYTELRWEPRDGIFVSIVAADQATAVKVFAAVRLDRAQRCVTPMRLSTLPPGASWTGCRTAFRSAQVPGQREWAWSEMAVQEPDGQQVRLWVSPPGSPDGAAFQPDRTVAGHPAQWRTTDLRGLLIPGFGPVDLRVFEAGGFRSALLTEDEATWYANRLQIIEDLTNPAAWPTSATR